MSYTRVRAMRSNRYPLMGGGMGCGCAMHGVGESSMFGRTLRQRVSSLFSNSAPETGSDPGSSDSGVIEDDGMSTALTVGIVSVGVLGLGGLGWWLMRRRRRAAASS